MSKSISRRHWFRTAASAIATLPNCSGLYLGNVPPPRFGDEEQFDAATLRSLRSKTAVVLLQPEDEPLLESYRALLPRAWTFSPLEVVLPRDFDDYRDTSKYQYFTSHILVVPDGWGRHTRTGLVLVDSLDEESEVRGYCRYPLGVGGLSASAILNGDELVETDYTYLNWNPGSLALYLRAIQRDVESGKRRGYYDDMEDDPGLTTLKKRTLYVPNYVLRFVRKQTEVPLEAAEIFAEYPYKFEVLSSKALGELVGTDLAIDAPGSLVLDCAISAGEKLVSVYSPRDGLIYRRYSDSDRLHPKDLVRLVEASQEVGTK